MSYDCLLLYFSAIAAAGAIFIVVRDAVVSYRNRIKFEIRILEEADHSSPDYSNRNQRITFEIANKSPKGTALKQKIYLEGYTPKGRKVSMVFKVRRGEYDVPGYTPKTIFALADKMDVSFCSLLYRSYKFEFLRGPTQTIFVDSHNGKRLSPKEYRAGLKTFLKSSKQQHIDRKQ